MAARPGGTFEIMIDAVMEPTPAVREEQVPVSGPKAVSERMEAAR